MLTPAQRRLLQRLPLTSPNKVGDAMRLADVTQEEVAAAIGFTQATVSRVKTGTYGQQLPGETMRKFAHYFGCSIEDLFPARENAVAS